jgi:tripartite-type tricarboxylate transporter receptor subunit TctC
MRFALALIALVATGVLAQAEFPSKPVRILVPTTAGGVPDVLARTLGQRMAEAFGQPVVVENRAGAGGILAAESVLKSPADGHTLFLGDTGNYAVSAALYAKFPYDVQKDFVPVVLAAAPPVYLVANAASPFRSIRDFVRLAQAGPPVIYGSTGNGNVTHLAMEMFRSLTAANLTHVPYKGAAGLAPALLSGDVGIGFIGTRSSRRMPAPGSCASSRCRPRSAPRSLRMFRPWPRPACRATVSTSRSATSRLLERRPQPCCG